MKILEVIPHLQSGGGEKFVVDLSNTFSTLGHECTVTTLYDPSEEDILRQQLSPMVATSSLSKKRGVDLGCMYRLHKHIKECKPDVVHLHLNAIIYSLFAALFYRRCKYVATIHSEVSREAGAGLTKYIRKFLFGLNRVTPVTISDESQKSFENFYGYTAAMIPNGCSSYTTPQSNTWLKYREGAELLFVHAGRIHDVKNQLMLVKAFHRIIESGHKVRLLIAGRVADEKIYEEMKPYFSNDIVYVGEQQDVRAIMSASDGFCLTSKMEGMPITIIEAFSVGCVPIATPVGGCINMIRDAENGYLSEDVSTDAYVVALERFIALGESQRAAMKEQCIDDYHANYSIERTATNYIKLFGYEI
jgi:glycosyltransferase involved in cell wall biosynthesis